MQSATQNVCSADPQPGPGTGGRKRRPVKTRPLRAWAAAIASGCTLVAATAFGQAFPTKPVKIIVPFSAGTATDIVARQLGERLGAAWGQGVVIENQPGAAGNIGAATGAKAPPDGYTLVMLGLPHAINAALYKNVPYDIPRDFAPIARVTAAPMVIVANNRFPANTMAELIAMAKAKPNEIMYGTNGNGSVGHLALELLKVHTGAQLTHVPYKAAGPIVADVLGNQIPVAALAAATVVPHAASKSLKVLALTTARRSDMFPGVPTVAESGVPGYDISGWGGLVAPLRTPPPVIEKIAADVAKIGQTKEFVEQVRKQALEVDLAGPEAYKAFLASELDKWSKLVKASGAKVE